jgi:hypothetical protein
MSRTKTMLLTIVLTLLMLGIAVSTCQNKTVDVNNCGASGQLCPMIGSSLFDRGCCDISTRQFVFKAWHDCNGDGTADCEVAQVRLPSVTVRLAVLNRSDRRSRPCCTP